MESRTEIKTEEKGVTAKELLENTYQIVSEKYGDQEIELAEPAKVEMADNTTPHGASLGYINYSDGVLLNLEENSFVLFYGDETVGYPANTYQADLTAIEVPEEFESKENRESNQEEFEGGLRSRLDDDAVYLIKSLIHSKGKLKFGSSWYDDINPFENQMRKLVAPKFEEYALEKDETPLGTSRQPARNEPGWDSEFAEVLADSIVDVLKDFEWEKKHRI